MAGKPTEPNDIKWKRNNKPYTIYLLLHTHTHSQSHTPLSMSIEQWAQTHTHTHMPNRHLYFELLFLLFGSFSHFMENNVCGHNCAFSWRWYAVLWHACIIFFLFIFYIIFIVAVVNVVILKKKNTEKWIVLMCVFFFYSPFVYSVRFVRFVCLWACHFCDANCFLPLVMHIWCGSFQKKRFVAFICCSK